MKKLFLKEQARQIYKQHIKDKLSTYELSKIWKCSQMTICNTFKREGYTIRSSKDAMKDLKVRRKISDSLKMFTKEQELQIYKQHIKDKLSTAELAKIHNCSDSAIRNAIIRSGHMPRTKSESHKIFSKKEEQQICKQYVENELSTTELAKMHNCSQPTIRNVLIRNNVPLREISITNSTPEAIQRALKNSYGTTCYYHHKFFPSLGERDCFIKFIEKGFKVIHNFLNRFDFLLILPNNKKVVAEYHPLNGNGFDRNSLTNRQYYNQRRKLLNKYGYKNLKLVVIKDLKEIENLKYKGVVV